MIIPGFTAEASLGERGDSKHYYTIMRDSSSANSIVPSLAIGPIGGGGLGIISRCGASCKCCSADGNAHCCKVCDGCSPAVVGGLIDPFGGGLIAF
jgi:hypothetical protein